MSSPNHPGLSLNANTKNAEKNPELLNNSVWFQDFFNLSQDILVIFTKDLKLVKINSAGKQKLKINQRWDRVDWVGQSIEDVFPFLSKTDISQIIQIYNEHEIIEWAQNVPQQRATVIEATLLPNEWRS